MGQRPGKDDVEKKGHDRPSNGLHEPDATSRPVDWRPPEPWWHPDAVHWYNSLPRSGQAPLYQQSDAEQAHILGNYASWSMGQYRWVDEAGNTAIRVGAPDLQAGRLWMSGARELLTTETARRAAHVRLAQSHDDNALGKAVDQLIEQLQAGEGAI